MAFAEMASTFVDAYRQLLPEGYTVKTATKFYDAILVKDIESPISLLVGGKCREFTIDELENRKLWPKDAVKLEGICPVYYGLYYRPEETPSPSWLGAKESYAWGMVDGERLLNHAFSPWAPLHHRGIEPSLSDMSQEEFNIALSALLPEWVYFYQAPRDKYTVPYVLNQGKKHYFIKPQ